MFSLFFRSEGQKREICSLELNNRKMYTPGYQEYLISAMEELGTNLVTLIVVSMPTLALSPSMM